MGGVAPVEVTEEGADEEQIPGPRRPVAGPGEPSVPGGFQVEPLARGGFPDNVDATFGIKLDSRTIVTGVKDPSNVLVAKGPEPRCGHHSIAVSSSLSAHRRSRASSSYACSWASAGWSRL